VTGRWFSSGTLVSSINKTDHHDITEILLKVALNTINLNKSIYLNYWGYMHINIHLFDIIYNTLDLRLSCNISAAQLSFLDLIMKSASPFLGGLTLALGKCADRAEKPK
jgi:hypothetical protein